MLQELLPLSPGFHKSVLGVVFTGGSHPPSALINKVLKGKNAMYIAADSGLIAAENAGIKPHFIVGDMDSVNEQRLLAYPQDSVIRYPTDKDHTDTELAIQTALKKGCNEIWIIGGGGGRLDHLFAIRSLFERDFFPSYWITNNEYIYCLNGSSPGNCSLSLTNCSLVSVFPLGTGPWEAKSTGLKWPLDNLSWNCGFFGLSNLAPKGEFSITAVKGRFMAVLPFCKDVL